MLNRVWIEVWYDLVLDFTATTKRDWKTLLKHLNFVQSLLHHYIKWVCTVLSHSELRKSKNKELLILIIFFSNTWRWRKDFYVKSLHGLIRLNATLWLLVLQCYIDGNRKIVSKKSSTNNGLPLRSSATQ